MSYFGTGCRLKSTELHSGVESLSSDERDASLISLRSVVSGEGNVGVRTPDTGANLP